MVKRIFLTLLLVTAMVTPCVDRFIYADTTAGIPAAESVLIIRISGTGYRDAFYNNVRTAIQNAGGIVTTVTVAPGDNDGIWDDLQASLGCSNATTCLDSFCEVWDLRFLEDHPVFTGYANEIYADTITSGSATADLEIFKNFLVRGGHLYLQGEHQDFPARNMSLLQFIADVSGAISYPGVLTTNVDWTTFDNSAVTENFRTDYNSLTVVNTRYPGIITAPGNGHPATTNGGNALDLAFRSSDMNVGNGKMFVNFDTNAFSNDTGCNTNPCYDGTEEDYLQNVYDFLASCYKYSIIKTVSDNALCVGDNTVYSVTYNNLGTKALTGIVVWDTLPTCLTYQSSTPAPSGNSGQLYWWNIGTVNPGVSATINITVRATCLP